MSNFLQSTYLARGKVKLNPFQKKVSCLVEQAPLLVMNENNLGQREFWFPIALLAFAVLMIEWYVYHQRLQVPTVMTPVMRRRQA